MNIDDIYSGRFLKAANLNLQPFQRITVRILSTELVQYEDGKKAIGLHLAEYPDKILGLNRTNVENLRSVLGDNWEHGWAGSYIELCIEKVQFQGNMVDSVRAYPINPNQPPQIAPQGNQPPSATSGAPGQNAPETPPQSLEQGAHNVTSGNEWGEQ